MYAIYIPGKCLRALFKRPWELTRDTTVNIDNKIDLINSYLHYVEGKKRKRKFTVFSRRKEPKSKERQKENDKTEGKGSKTYGGGKKLIPPKKEKEKGKKKLTPKADKHKQKQKKKERKKSRKEMRTVMLGLDSSGKTSILSTQLIVVYHDDIWPLYCM